MRSEHRLDRVQARAQHDSKRLRMPDFSRPPSCASTAVCRQARRHSVGNDHREPVDLVGDTFEQARMGDSRS